MLYEYKHIMLYVYKQMVLYEHKPIALIDSKISQFRNNNAHKTDGYSRQASPHPRPGLDL
jgi:hypothetical protein